MRNFIFLLLLAPSLLFAEALGGCEQHVKYGSLLDRPGYALAHDNDKKLFTWLAYHLTTGKMTGTHSHHDHLPTVHDLPSGRRAELSDNTWCSFGHSHVTLAEATK